MPRKTILLVDDDLVFLEALSAVLGNEFEVQTAKDGEEAVAVIAAKAPDLIVLDVMLTYPSEGYDLGANLKSNPKTSKIPIVMLTGVDKMFEIRSRMEKSQVQCDAFLTKPPDFKELIETIHSQIEAAQKRNRPLAGS
jgi:CheY-like chemotaxis protein